MVSRQFGQAKSRWTRTALGLALALALCAQPRSASAAGLRVAIVPDLAYPGLDSCQACDGRFSAADARQGNAMPIGSLRVRLEDERGRLIAELPTSAQPNGRQGAAFGRVEGGVRLELVGLPAGWLPCRADGRELVLSATELEQAGGRVTIGLWRGCEPARDGRTDGTHAVAADQPRSAAAFHRQLSGQVFVDRDLDGRADVGEVGLAGVRVTLLQGSRAHRTRSNPSGSFTFRGLQSGDYVVEVEPPPGYRVTTAGRYTQVSGGRGPWIADAIAFGLIESEDGPPGGRLHTVAAWPQWAGAAATSSSVGMIGLVPEDGAGRHPNLLWKG